MRSSVLFYRQIARLIFGIEKQMPQVIGIFSLIFIVLYFLYRGIFGALISEGDYAGPPYPPLCRTDVSQVVFATCQYQRREALVRYRQMGGNRPAPNQENIDRLSIISSLISTAGLFGAGIYLIQKRNKSRSGSNQIEEPARRGMLSRTPGYIRVRKAKRRSK
jgi:hypothetical protein